MDKFVVPQFIDVEDKIIGPLTVRQFLTSLATVGAVFVDFKLFDFAAFLATGIPTFIIGGVFAFFRVNGQPFHYFCLNLLQTLRRPGLRVWDKDHTDDELRAIVRILPPPPPPPRIRKAPLAATKLTELTLIVNTGGVYNPDAD